MGAMRRLLLPRLEARRYSSVLKNKFVKSQDNERNLSSKMRSSILHKVRQHSCNLSLLKSLQLRRGSSLYQRRLRSPSVERLRLLNRIHRLENKLVESRQLIREMLDNLIARG